MANEGKMRRNGGKIGREGGREGVRGRGTSIVGAQGGKAHKGNERDDRP